MDPRNHTAHGSTEAQRIRKLESMGPSSLSASGDQLIPWPFCSSDLRTDGIWNHHRISLVTARTFVERNRADIPNSLN